MEVYRILIEKFKESSNLGNLSDMYIKDMFLDHMRRLQDTWKKNQLLQGEDGIFKTEEQWEAQVLAMHLEDLKKGRHLTRHRGVSEI